MVGISGGRVNMEARKKEKGRRKKGRIGQENECTEERRMKKGSKIQRAIGGGDTRGDKKKRTAEGREFLPPSGNGRPTDYLLPSTARAFERMRA
jgi:hypothetical protein